MSGQVSARATSTSTGVRASRLQSPDLRAYISLAVGVLCIGFSAIFTKWAGVPGPVSGFYRVAIATAVLAFPFAVQWGRANRASTTSRAGAEGRGDRGIPGFTLPLLGATALAGLFFSLDLSFWNTSLLLTSAANSTLLGNTSTLWVSIGATLFFGVKLRRRFWLGMLLALAGAAIIVGRDTFIHPDLSWGDLLAVMSSLFYAGYILNTQRVRQRIDTLSFMWVSSAAAAALLLAYCLATGLPLWGFSAETIWALAALGLISHVIGWMAINYSLGHLPAPLTSVTLLSQPVITAIASVPLLGEGISLFQVAGGLLVLLGIFIVNRR